MHLHEDVNSFDFVLKWPQTASKHQNETKNKKGEEQEENKKKKEKQQNEKIE